eukprot:gb/GECG01016295.1/.p1 GENE.gb/GECG01016295.1/~~gb/GECG01016295.1/.p1  ORF type:complete len:355 (+),score=29.34 gb/GECG01016295.1/:1-1065(+)
MSGHYALGVTTGIGATFLSAAGLTLQKSSHKQRDATDRANQKAYWKYPRFLLGVFLMLVGALMSVLVFALIGQSEASSLGALTMVWNAFLSWRFLGEEFTRIDAITNTLMVSGTIIAVSFRGASKEEKQDIDVDAIIEVMDRDAVWIGSLIIGAVMAVCLYFIYEKRDAEVTLLSPKEKWALCGAKAFTSGLFSGTTGFCTKSTIEVVGTAFSQHRWEEFERWQFWIIALSLPVSLMCQIGFLNSALRQFDAMMVVPIYQSMIVLAGVGFGWLYFNEASGQPTISIVMFLIGCLITVTGILLLALKVMEDTSKLTKKKKDAENCCADFIDASESTPLPEPDDISEKQRLVSYPR